VFEVRLPYLMSPRDFTDDSRARLSA